MRAEIDDLIARIRTLETELEDRLAERRRAFGYRMRQGRIVISRRVRKRQQALKIGLHRYLFASGVMAVLTAPFIYAVVLPIAALDAFASLYQSICFRVYGLARVRRRDYVVFDRHKLPYLNVIQKLNCLYCAYANGVLATGRTIFVGGQIGWNGDQVFESDDFVIEEEAAGAVDDVDEPEIELEEESAVVPPGMPPDAFPAPPPDPSPGATAARCRG